MIEPIDDMPAGTIGLRARGKLTRDDYRDVLEPALRRGVESGELRLLFLLTDFDGLEPGAWIEDARTGLRTWVLEHSAWRRLALVTDVEWVIKGMRMFAWVAPGEATTFEPDELEQAKTWIAG